MAAVGSGEGSKGFLCTELLLIYVFSSVRMKVRQHLWAQGYLRRNACLEAKVLIIRVAPEGR